MSEQQKYFSTQDGMLPMVLPTKPLCCSIADMSIPAG